MLYHSTLTGVAGIVAIEKSPEYALNPCKSAAGIESVVPNVPFVFRFVYLLFIFSFFFPSWSMNSRD